MGEELAMLRQLIGQLQELLLLYGSPPPHTPLHLPPFYLLHHNEEEKHRWFFPCIDEGSADDCCDLAKRSESFTKIESSKPLLAKKPRKERNRGESFLEETTTNETMDQEIWQEFPEDLFEAVIARLPVAAFFRFRLVCQKWNSVLESESFSQRCAEVPQTIPWFYTITNENANWGALYDPSSKKWHHLVIPSLPKKTIVLPVASAGGLVCFLDIGHRNFYVSNPLTQSLRELPARPVKVWSRVAVGMTLNGKYTSEGYKILWVGCEGEYEVYDSLKDAWIKPGIMPTSIKLPVLLNFRSQPVSIGNTLFFMISDPEGIMSYDTISDIWKQYIIPAPPNLSDHTLAECNGKLMLVGLVTKNAATCACIWELQKMTLLWKEVDRMPNIWCLEFYGKHVRMSCLGNTGCLLMLSLRSRQMNRLVTYNVVAKEWVKVPGCMVPRGRKSWIACGTAFFPCPTAMA